jgi:hypothetical protein
VGSPVVAARSRGADKGFCRASPGTTTHSRPAGGLRYKTKKKTATTTATIAPTATTKEKEGKEKMGYVKLKKI